MAYRVTFKNVGMNQLTWHVTLKELTDRALNKAIRAKGALASKGIDFAFNDDGTHGEIYVGGFRQVGTMTVEPACEHGVVVDQGSTADMSCAQCHVEACLG